MSDVTNGQIDSSDEIKDSNRLDGMYKNYFLEYASYVILDRAVPYYEDGLKPVQRRILHSMFEKNDGRYHKVANLIGHTMQYHPHGDASIGDALVNIGQKNLLIDCQGNWGNVLTGDSAAAARYIEARLTPFALEVLFNPETTNWSPSYDGRNDEPNFLPVKFPLLLSLGVEGIAVGLSTKIVPHNAKELVEAVIAYYKGKKFELNPDFIGGGLVDVSNYNKGARGGKLKVRAVIEVTDKKTLTIREIPYGVNTTGLMDSIVNANDKGKIKIKKVEDNTARNVEIIIHLPANADPHKTMAGLYAFTDCEVSISPNCCVIDDKKPIFTDVDDLLKKSAEHSRNLLEWELLNTLKDLQNKWHMASLERIFIENKVYKVIEEATSREDMLSKILEGLRPFLGELRRAVTEEEIAKLGEIPIRRISRFDADKNKNLLVDLDEKIEVTQGYLDNLTEYCVNYFKNLLKKYGDDWERKTKVESFQTVSAAEVAVANLKYFVNKTDGFVGTALKKDELVFECSSMDEVIVFRKNGTFTVTKVDGKTFIGKGILNVEKFDRKDTRRIYNLVYEDKKSGVAYAKRFAIGGVTRNKEYAVATASEKCVILYMTSNPNGEAEKIEVLLKPKARIKLNFPFEFSSLEVKGRGVRGNTLSKHPVKKVKKLADGESTLGSRELFYHPLSAVVNDDNGGRGLGQFEPDDSIVVLRTHGKLNLFAQKGTVHLGTDIAYVGRFAPDKEFYALYFDKANVCYFLKCFTLGDVAQGKDILYIPDEKKCVLLHSGVCADKGILVEYSGIKGNKKHKELVLFEDNSQVRSNKAAGSRLTRMRQIHKVGKVPKEVWDGDKTPDKAMLKVETLPLDKLH